MNAIMKTVQLNRQYQSGEETINALKNVSISIPEKSLTILRGRSGSGKTTLINLLGAIDTPTSGQIFFEEKKLDSLSDNEKTNLRRVHVGFVFQSGALMPNMNVFENIDFALRVSSPELKDRKSRIEHCLDLVGLKKRQLHMPLELSGGEMQRVAIARAISHKPKIIFADEPTSALDTLTGLQVIKVFKELVSTEDITIVMTTHDPNMLDVADCIYTLKDGEIVDE
ncbi:ABC transporter ATP-binding protein [Clostridium sp. MSJ-4]|uniref:ABC transporter ATP-binding protein n=1 Tax=Clostridium simiarum TaxID=2841506 RepID=A0ABS6F1G4_9CLOT|nr:ABC transporter ATP-binding protein [Clostridium simiarum]MBU5592352.1 ABC transporter ATP-binding protein [Clostridium simiarum]